MRFKAFLSNLRVFFSLNCRILSPLTRLIFTTVVPSSFKIEDIFLICSSYFSLNETSLIGLLNNSLSEAIFWTLILVNLFLSLETFFIMLILENYLLLRFPYLILKHQRK